MSLDKQRITSEKTCQVKNGAIGKNNEQSCKEFGCSHNVFWAALFKDQRGQKSQWRPTETTLSRSIKNCLYLLDEAGATSQEIAELYGITRQAVERLERRAEKRVKSKMAKEDFF
jgi:predicted DNA-binding protein (UPF0251 family)